MKRSAAFIVLLALGAIIAITGLIYGLGSRQVAYKHAGQGTVLHYLSSDGTDYLQMTGDSSLYIIHEDNFTPKISKFADGDTISFAYDPTDTTPIDVSSNVGTHLVGTAAKVVEITYFDDVNGGQQTYETPEYAQNPQGYTLNHWGIGIALFILGLLMVGGAFLLPRSKVSPAPTPSVNTTTEPQSAESIEQQDEQEQDSQRSEHSEQTS